jgi:uncharacterized membrane protein
LWWKGLEPTLGKWVSREEETTIMHVEESVVINRPPKEVFDYVANRHNLPEWSSLVQEVRTETQGPLSEEGTRFTTVAKLLGRSFETPFEVIVHDPPRRHTDRSTGGPFPQQYAHIIEEVEGGGTRLTEVTEGELGGFFRLAGPLLEMAGRRQFRADLETLKYLLEAQD